LKAVLGLDNIGAFDRNHMPRGIKNATGRCNELDGMFSLNMLRMSLELAKLMKFMKKYQLSFRLLLNIALAMHHWKKDLSLWDDKDNFIMMLLKLMEAINVKSTSWLVLFQCLL
jgi:hypothetical protein